MAHMMMLPLLLALCFAWSSAEYPKLGNLTRLQPEWVPGYGFHLFTAIGGVVSTAPCEPVPSTPTCLMMTVGSPYNGLGVIALDGNTLKPRKTVLVKDGTANIQVVTTTPSVSTTIIWRFDCKGDQLITYTAKSATSEWKMQNSITLPFCPKFHTFQDSYIVGQEIASKGSCVYADASKDEPLAWKNCSGTLPSLSETGSVSRANGAGSPLAAVSGLRTEGNIYLYTGQFSPSYGIDWRLIADVLPPKDGYTAGFQTVEGLKSTVLLGFREGGSLTEGNCKLFKATQGGIRIENPTLMADFGPFGKFLSIGCMGKSCVVTCGQAVFASPNAMDVSTWRQLSTLPVDNYALSVVDNVKEPALVLSGEYVPYRSGSAFVAFSQNALNWREVPGVNRYVGSLVPFYGEVNQQIIADTDGYLYTTEDCGNNWTPLFQYASPGVTAWATRMGNDNVRYWFGVNRDSIFVTTDFGIIKNCTIDLPANTRLTAANFDGTTAYAVARTDQNFLVAQVTWQPYQCIPNLAKWNVSLKLQAQSVSLVAVIPNFALISVDTFKYYYQVNNDGKWLNYTKQIGIGAKFAQTEDTIFFLDRAPNPTPSLTYAIYKITGPATSPEVVATVPSDDYLFVNPLTKTLVVPAYEPGQASHSVLEIGFDGKTIGKYEYNSGYARRVDGDFQNWAEEPHEFGMKCTLGTSLDFIWGPPTK